ncbi:MAG: HEAT repeat domain-containing protein [Deltaproteobacteria bacterium]|nr:HEAT repeat domain-containing protein [Deltaproteobacteria bacterium]
MLAARVVILELSFIGMLTAAALRAHLRRLKVAPLSSRQGFRWARRSLLRGDLIEGFDDGFLIDVRLPPLTLGDHVRIRVALEGLVPPNMLLLPTELVEASEADQSRPVVTGHSDFDRLYFASGPEIEVLARMTADARSLLLVLTSARLEKSTLEVEVSLRQDPAAAIPKVLQLARELAGPVGSPLDRLMERASSDRFAGARLRALEVLVARFPNTHETRTSAKAALADEDLGVRLVAAMFLSGEADEIVREISMTATPPLRAKAIRHVGKTFGWERARPIIEAGLADKGIVLSAAVFAFAVHGAARPPQERTVIRLRLESLYSSALEVSVEVIESLAILGDEGAEAFLLSRLEGEVPSIRAAAAQSLAKVGTPAAIPGLARAAGSPHPVVAKAARAALQVVRRRLGHVDEGRLSLTDERGDGALAVSEEGQLELATRPSEDS